MLHRDKAGPAPRADARRRHLLDTARALFVEHGFHRTGMAQIAAASGIRVGQIYRDFAGKEAIIAAIVELDVAAWLENDMLAAAVAAGDTGAVRAWIGRFGTGDEPRSECQMMADVLAESGRNPRIAAIYRATDARLRDSLTAALTALAGDARDVSALVDFILAASMGVATRRILHPGMSGEPFGRVIAAFLDRELGAAPG